MSIFSKLFRSKEMDEELAESNEASPKASEVYDDPATQVVQFDNPPKSDSPSKSDDNPETLPEAIRFIVEKWGKDYLQDRGFINVLNDFKVLKDIPAAKHIITTMQTNGYMEKITLAQNWELESKSISIKYADEFGAREDIVSYLVQCIGYGMKLSNEIPQYRNKENVSQHLDTGVQTPPNMKVNTNQTTRFVSNDYIEPYDPKRDLENYRYPTLDLLKKNDDDGKPYIDMAEQTANKNRIVEVLRIYGIEICSIKANIGPTITLYEISLAPGISIMKLRRLEDDIILSLSALGIRIIAPIPGKGTVGIEVPNAKPSIVSMESILNSKKFQESQMELPCALGKTITNEVFMFDLAKAPHLLVAGATGQGKSVSLNAIITSLLYKKHPAELKIVLVDPKKVEFSIYNPLINHFLAKVPDEDADPIITDVTKVVRTLNSLCKLMDTRCDLLKEVGARNIKEYNKKFINRIIPPRGGHGYMPYIVVIIDEFGDYLMAVGKEMEEPIIRLSQLAHIVGIHMVIATRHISRNIITEKIKFNFLSRISFRVVTMSDSKIIIDRPDARNLIGRGDMLYQDNGTDPVRVQCAFVDTPEVERTCDFISDQQNYGYPYELPDPDYVLENTINQDIDMLHLDPFFEDAARIIVREQIASTSLIQRKLAIGYNRAGRIMDQLEKAGILGTAMGSKPREVLIQDEVSLNNLLNRLR